MHEYFGSVVCFLFILKYARILVSISGFLVSHTYKYTQSHNLFAKGGRFRFSNISCFVVLGLRSLKYKMITELDQKYLRTAILASSSENSLVYA